MSLFIETVQTVATSATPILVTYLGFKGKFKFDDLNKKIIDLEGTTKRSYNELTTQISYINSKNTLTKSLRKVCNSSIAYTHGAHDLNSFKITFTDAIIGLSMATLTCGFKSKVSISEDIFHGYMDVAGNKIIRSYKELPEEFVDTARTPIQEASSIYYEKVCKLINDTVFNDKQDRFIDLTVAFLRSELMIITKHWWTYSKTESTYTEIK